MKKPIANMLAPPIRLFPAPNLRLLCIPYIVSVDENKGQTTGLCQIDVQLVLADPPPDLSIA